jgi:hypothetical protein
MVKVKNLYRKHKFFQVFQFVPAVGREGNAISTFLCSYSKDLDILFV